MSGTRQKVIANSFVRSNFEKQGVSIHQLSRDLKEERTTVDRFLYELNSNNMRLHVKFSRYYGMKLDDWYQGYTQGIDTKGGITISLSEGNVGAPH